MPYNKENIFDLQILKSQTPKNTENQKVINNQCPQIVS